MLHLDSDQRRALKAFQEGKNLAVFGGGGCGKTVLLSAMMTVAQDKYGPFPAVASCALTTHAAERVGGRTIHSLFGAPPFWPFTPHLWDLIKSKPHLLQVLSSVRVLLIDEITLLSDRVLDTLDVIMRNTAQTRGMQSVPFGGRQIVLCGDPFQLDAIIDETSSHEIPLSSSNSLVQFTIDAHNQRPPGPMQTSLAWYLTFSGFGDGVVVFLSQNHRQCSDRSFYQLLSRVRLGKQSEADIKMLNASSSFSTYPPQSHTQLCLRRKQMNRINMERLSNLPGQLHTSAAEDAFCTLTTLEARQKITRRLNAAASSHLNIKVGMELLLTSSWNGFAPGTRGKVIDITKNFNEMRLDRIYVSLDSKSPVWIERKEYKILAHDASLLAKRLQFPVCPAYALTVHRSQGMTINKVSMQFNENERWVPAGFVYVVLSRCPTFSGLWIKGLTANVIKQSVQSRQLMEKIEQMRFIYPNRVIGKKEAESLMEIHQVGIKRKLLSEKRNQDSRVKKSRPLKV